jgi:hypothetical protein
MSAHAPEQVTDNKLLIGAGRIRGYLFRHPGLGFSGRRPSAVEIFGINGID